MARPRIYSTQAIVLRTSPLGEADRLLTLFTPGLGKIHATARGVRKPTSKLGGHLDLLTRSSLTLNKGRSLDTVTGADNQEAFLSVKSDLGRLSRAIYLAELVDALNPLDAPNPTVYTLFLDGLRTLETQADHDLALRYIELQFLSCAGFLPELERCVECQGQIAPNRHSLSPSAGGVLCPGCSGAHADAMPLSVDALKVLRYISANSLPAALGVVVRPPLHRELAALMSNVLRYTLERELRSTAFLRSVGQPGPLAGTPATAGT